MERKCTTSLRDALCFEPTRYEPVFLHRVSTASSRSFTLRSSDRVKAAATKSNCTWRERRSTVTAARPPSFDEKSLLGYKKMSERNTSVEAFTLGETGRNCLK